MRDPSDLGERRKENAVQTAPCFFRSIKIHDDRSIDDEIERIFICSMAWPLRSNKFSEPFEDAATQ